MKESNCTIKGPVAWLTRFKILTVLIFVSAMFTKLSAQQVVCPAPSACTVPAGTIVVDGNPCEWSTANIATFPISTYISDPFGNGVVDNQFTSGSKDFDLANALRWEIGQTKAKNDIANGAVVLIGTTLYFAGDRTSNEGAAQIGFWFYLGGTGPNTRPDGTKDFAPPHTVGDLFVLADFSAGGRNATVSVYQWVGTGGNVVGSNGTLNTTTCSGIVAQNNDATALIPTGWSFVRPCYDYNEFYEGAIDLTCLTGVLPNLCFSSFLLETRASPSITSALDDFIAGSFAAKPNAPVVPPASRCGSGSVTLTATCTGTDVRWYTAPSGGTFLTTGGAYTVSGSSLTINPLAATQTFYASCYNASLQCESDTRTAVVATINQIPVAPTVDVTQPTCTVATGTVCVTAPLDAGGIDYEYSNNGGAYQDGLCFTVAANASYSITVRNKNSTCVSTPTMGTMGAQPSTPAAPTVNVTQPTCTIATGTVCVTAPLDAGGIDYEYSNNGGAYQDGLCFTVAANAAYSITVRNKSGNCVSTPTAGTMGAQPSTPAAPTVNVTQPTCTVATGMVCVTAPLDAGGIDYEYSNNGGAYQDGLCFTVAANAAYSITVRNKSGNCVSTPTAGTMGAQPSTPAAPTVNVTQPTCTVATGMVCVTAPLDGGGIDYEYSNNGGAYQDGLCFTVAANAAYSITVRNKSGNCVSTPTAGTMGAQPSTTAAPTVNVTQPTCTVATGTVCVTTPLDAGGIDYEYSNNGGAYQDGLCFTVAANAAYSITVRNKNSTCVSTPTTGTMGAQPSTPAAPTVNVTQPTCTVATGTVCVTTPLDAGGIDYEYSNNGGAYQDGLCFTVAANAAYSITVRNKNSTCVSTPTAGTMGAQPSTPAAPTVNVTQPTCTVATGTVCVTAPLDAGGIDYEYSNNGGAYQDGLCFTVAANASYSIRVRNKNSTCVSTPTTGTMGAQPSTTAAPTVNVTQPTCTVATGTVCVTAPLDAGGIDYEYSNNGGAYQDGLCFTVAANAAYSITVRNKNSTCVSTPTTGTMGAQPSTPAAPTVNVTQPTCTVATGTVCVTAPLDAGGIDYEYSNNGGAYQDGLCFTVAANASYSITVRNKNSTCVSTPTMGTMGAQPSTPAAPTVNVTQPTCTIATGTVCVTAPLDAGGIDYEYSNNGGAYQDGLCFTVAANASYSIRVRNKNSTCVSTPTTGTMGAQPSTPATIASNTGPICVGGTFSIAATNSPGASFSWTGPNSFTSMVQNPPAFTNATLAMAGQYTVTVSLNGCSSTSNTTVSIVANPIIYVPTASPFCAGDPAKGSVTLPNSQTGVNYTLLNDAAMPVPGQPVKAGNTGSSLTWTGLDAGGYLVQATGSGPTNCANLTQPAIVVENPLPNPMADNKTICLGDCVTLTATPAGGVWSGTGVSGSQFCSTGLAAGPYTVTYTVTNGATGCSNSATATINVNVCGGPICTYTQGYYGNANGKSCDGTTGGFSTDALIAKSLGNYPGGTLVIGKSGSSVVLTNTAAARQCIIDKLPGGGSSKELPAGNIGICNLTATYLKNGRINNVLLSQTIALGLNIGITSPSTLGSFALQAGVLATADADGGCGSSVPKTRVCNYNTEAPYNLVSVTNEYTYRTISTAIYNAIAPKTVAGLMELANNALANTDGVVGSENGVSLSAISNAVSAINEVFDECKIFIGWNVAPCAPNQAPLTTTRISLSRLTEEPGSSKLSVSTFPNPFTDQVKFEIKSHVAGIGRIDVYNMTGQKLETINVGQVFAGKSRMIDYRVAPVNRANMIYILTVGAEQVVGKLMNIK